MESLHDALMKRMGNYGIEKAVSATLIIEAANRILPPMVRAKTYRGDILTVEAKTSTDAYFFKQDLETYLERINAAIPQAAIKNIRIHTKHTA